MREWSPNIPAKDKLDGVFWMITQFVVVVVVAAAIIRVLVVVLTLQTNRHDGSDADRPKSPAETSVEECSGWTP